MASRPATCFPIHGPGPANRLGLVVEGVTNTVAERARASASRARYEPRAAASGPTAADWSTSTVVTVTSS